MFIEDHHGVVTPPLLQHFCVKTICIYKFLNILHNVRAEKSYYYVFILNISPRVHIE